MKRTPPPPAQEDPPWPPRYIEYSEEPAWAVWVAVLLMVAVFGFLVLCAVFAGAAPEPPCAAYANTPLSDVPLRCLPGAP